MTTYKVSAKPDHTGTYTISCAKENKDFTFLVDYYPGSNVIIFKGDNEKAVLMSGVSSMFDIAKIAMLSLQLDEVDVSELESDRGDLRYIVTLTSTDEEPGCRDSRSFFEIEDMLFNNQSGAVVAISEYGNEITFAGLDNLNLSLSQQILIISKAFTSHAEDTDSASFVEPFYQNEIHTLSVCSF